MSEPDDNSLLSSVLGPNEVQLYADILQLALNARLKLATAAQDDPGRPMQSALVVRYTLMAASVLAGQEARNLSYGPRPPDGDRQAQLEALYCRVTHLREFYRNAEGVGDGSSLKALGNEIIAVANGDAPQLMARITKASTRNRKFRIAQHRLRALQWVGYLAEKGYPRPEDEVARAFDNTARNTLRDWRSELVDILGEHAVAEAIMFARHELAWPFMAVLSPDDIQRQLLADGKAYGAAGKAEVADAPRGPYSDIA